MIDSSKNLIDFYISQFHNVTVDYYPFIKLEYDIDNIIKLYNDYELNIIGVNDFGRTDGMKNIFRNSYPDVFFVEKFYLCYDLDYNERVNSFSFNRNYELENKKYLNFIDENTNEYILYHEDGQRNLILNNNKNLGIKWVNLNNTTNIFFDYIKILENAKEIHLFDSVWASVIYLLDSKYGLFKHIPIKVYCLRGYQQMFTEPIKLKNWIIE